MDCACLTFEQLSIYYRRPVSYNVWYQELIKDGHPPDLQKCLEVFNSHFPNSLVCVYKSPDIAGSIIMLDAPIKFKSLKNPVAVPYILICNEFTEYRANINEEATCHMCLCYFSQDYVTLITPMKPQNIDDYAILPQQISYEDFWKMTLLVFQINIK
jgi:hypothetical protein